MLQRMAASAFGALVMGIVGPILYILIFGIPGNLNAFIRIAVIAAVTGATLGALFPKLFSFLFESFMDI